MWKNGTLPVSQNLTEKGNFRRVERRGHQRSLCKPENRSYDNYQEEEKEKFEEERNRRENKVDDPGKNLPDQPERKPDGEEEDFQECHPELSIGPGDS